MNSWLRNGAFYALGFISAAAMPAAAEQVVIRCQPMLKADLPPCNLGLHLEYGYTPNRCRNS